MLILHSAPQLNPLSGYLERSNEFLLPNCSSAGLQLLQAVSSCGPLQRSQRKFEIEGH